MKIFVTGVSSGIGRALALELLKRGDDVWGVARRTLEMPGLRFTRCDVRNADEVARVHRQTRTENFLPDVVVLNAGILEVDTEDLYAHHRARQVLATNVEGALVWVETFLPQFVERRSGQFIAISSILAHRPDPSSVSYAASKAALSMAFRSLRLRYRDTGVQFKTVHFGPVDTPVVPRFAQARTPRWVLSATEAADCVMRALEKRGGQFYYPWSSWVIRATSLVPDSWFHHLTKRLRR
jgi:short-subunit dehydrogenase